MPRLKNKPPQPTKKEKKAKKREEEERQKQQVGEQEASQPGPSRPRPPRAPKIAVPQDLFDGIDCDEEKYKFIETTLHKVKEVAERENETRRQIREFHERIGKIYVSDMNESEKKEAYELYNKLQGPHQQDHGYMNKILTEMKQWRYDAANKAKAAGEINALELLQLRHGCLPLVHVFDNPEPYGTGALAWQDNSRPEKGDEVVAFLEDSKTWIVAEISGSVSNHRYECIDIDDDDQKIFTLARKQLIPLPKFTCDYEKFKFMAFGRKAHVLALFPGTTCFYPGVVIEPPAETSGFYKVSFVDTENPDKFAPPVAVSERYIVAWRKDPKMYIRPEKRMQLAAAGDEPPQAEEEKPVTEVKKRTYKKKPTALKALEIDMVDDKDVPGPAPKARPETYYESPDEDAKKKVRRGLKKKREGKVKEPKIKIRRARVPEHKKKQYNRLFGKRRKSRKPKAGVIAEGAAPIEDKDVPSTSEKIEEVEEIPSGNVELSSIKSDNGLSRESDESEESDLDFDDEDDAEEQDGDSHETSNKQDDDDEEEEEDDDEEEEEEEDEEVPSGETAQREGTPLQPAFPHVGESESELSEEEEEEELLMPEPEDIPMGYPTIQSDDSSDDSCDSDAGSYISSSKKEHPTAEDKN